MKKNLPLTIATIALLFSGCMKCDDCSYYTNDDAQTLEHDGETREYVVYVPSTYDEDSTVPVVLNFHGFGGLASEYMTEADMRPQAESDTFILVYPQGASLNGFSHWNAALPGNGNKSSVDDLGFVDALIDQLNATYNIDQDRIYACGYSNGGMMSYALACYLGERIAAIGSVSGSMLDQSSTCEPSHPIPLMTLHGTSDDVLPYAGDDETYSIESTIAFWVNVNNTDPSPTADTVASNGMTIEHYIYADGDSSVAVEHYKFVDGGHVWFQSDYQGSTTSQLLWDFFSQYDVHGLRN